MGIFAYVFKKINSEFELSQSVRLVKKFFPDSKIVVIGDKPTINGIDEHIPFVQVGATRYERMTRSVIRLCNTFDEFVLMYDDIFLNNQYEFTPKNRGELYEHGMINTNYRKIITNCRNILQSRNLPTLNYECHQPEIINSKKFLEIIGTIDITEPHFVKTIYFNHLQPEPDTIPNLKADGHNIIKAKRLYRQHHCFSTGEGLSREMKNFIRSL